MKALNSKPGFSISLKAVAVLLVCACLISLPLMGLFAPPVEPISPVNPTVSTEDPALNQTGSICGKLTDAETGEELIGATIVIEALQLGNISDFDGKYCLEKVPPGKQTVKISYIGYKAAELEVEVKPGARVVLDHALTAAYAELSEVIVIESVEEEVYDMSYSIQSIEAEDIQAMPQRQLNSVPGVQSNKDRRARKDAKRYKSQQARPNANSGFIAPQSNFDQNVQLEPSNTESYDFIQENEFKGVMGNPLSTFSIDVDAASYSNVRRFINSSMTPPADAVRIEEMVNYFSYEYPQPKKDIPFSVVTEISETPWNDTTKLIHIGLQGLEIDYSEASPSNLVFLIDVSGSMNSANKLPLVQESLNMLVDQLDPKDRIALVVYAGSAGAVLPSTPAGRKDVIKKAINQLRSGGSTAGGAGIRLAYDIAERNLIEGGNNRVILCTDGDFNVGASSDSEMTRLIEEKRKTGISITVCGFGMGNYKDSKMESIADHGNGNYYYIDGPAEAKKIFVSEMQATLFTIAKDVKLQLEFNPAKVKSYRLIGYENRMLAKEDFNDDTKDAGELGAGHTVTALYEVVLADRKKHFDEADSGKGNGKGTPEVDELRYQQTQVLPEAYTDEILTLKLRFKQPNGSKSKLIEQSLVDKRVDLDKSSDNFRWSAAVAAWGMLLRGSEFSGDATHEMVLDLARGSKGADPNGYRAEFIQLVQQSSGITASTR